jgi:hypothetical protein
VLANEFKHIRPSQPDEERKSLRRLAIGSVPLIRQRGQEKFGLLSYSSAKHSIRMMLSGAAGMERVVLDEDGT